MSIAEMIENRTRLAHMEIEGGQNLKGEVIISGAKNAALPIIAGCLLIKGEITLHNVPNLDDVTTLAGLLASLGARVIYYDDGSKGLPG